MVRPESLCCVSIAFAALATAVLHEEQDELMLVQIQAQAYANTPSLRPPHTKKCQVSLPPKELHWLHCPKTGSSFASTLANANFNLMNQEHRPLPEDVTDKELSLFTTLLRDPAQRLASSVADIKSRGNTESAVMKTWGFNYSGSSDCTARIARDLVLKGKTPANDNCLSSLVGCQSNMLLGTGCMFGGTPHSPADIELAKSRLDKFFFVGLLEEWDLSMCLFNFKLTGKRFVEECQLFNSHPTAGRKAQGASYATYDVKGYPRDVADEELYMHAKQNFKKELLEHGINTESCAFSFNGESRG